MFFFFGLGELDDEFRFRMNVLVFNLGVFLFSGLFFLRVLNIPKNAALPIFKNENAGKIRSNRKRA